jgi:dipeptidyl aminopeptidase/acylaminoacyl peptidase
MHKGISVAITFFISILAISQTKLDKLTVEKIMRDPKWIGTSPSSPQWSTDSRTLFFSWNPEQVISDSLYYITIANKTPVKATPPEKQSLVSAASVTYNTDRTAYVYSKDADIFYTEIKSGKTKRITNTTDIESNPQFTFNQLKIAYNRNQNLYTWDILSGETVQLTNTKTGSAPRTNDPVPQEEWLKNDQLKYLEILRQRKEKKEAAETYTKNTKSKELRSIYLEDKRPGSFTISADGRFIAFTLTKPASNAKQTIVPNYVTESGYTVDISARTKVGGPQSTTEFFVYDTEKDTVLAIKTDSLPGIKDIPGYFKDYPVKLEERKKKNTNRQVTFSFPRWAPKGGNALLDIGSADNKDRWIMLWNATTSKLALVDHQHDDAWIGGPNIFSGIGWIDETTCWFQSEVSGYSHLYTFNIQTGEKKMLTSGNYEVQQARLSADKKYFYITTNEVHPGEKQFYRLPVKGGKAERITTMTGSNTVSLSPDEKYLAVLYSYSNKPWELYLQENKPGGKTEQITFKAQSDEFRSYAWRDPELISFTARDGAQVYARVYKPAAPPSGAEVKRSSPAVLFVHGAGYLQNAHKWWSSYFREYMFNNLLADNGYYVMDIDYRGSAGYGRDWRTGIYRYMGGKDLSDHVDAVNYMIKNFGVNADHVGIYGGSYGGFITLMGLFNEPSVFTAGAALRPVTDWANYNHEYTSDILNEPQNDSIAYRRSSPLYFAEGLKGHLLMCHGMIDDNVHYQDVVKLCQRLIELGKDNWELASYPLEEHGFIEPSSWTDEYKRIFKLFERVLKR